MDNSFKFNPYEALKSILEITSYHTGDEFIEHTAIEIKKLFQADLVYITKAIDFNPTTKVKILYSTNDKVPNIIDLSGVPGKFVFDNKIIKIKEHVKYNFLDLLDEKFESFYGIPITDGIGNCVGHIAIYSKLIRELPEEINDIALIYSRKLEREIRRIELETENQIIRNQLQELTITDTLTSLFNRRYFGKVCSDVFAQVNRGSTKATLAYLDIDDFKSINDKFGHEGGDVVLKYFAEILLDNTRKGLDYVFRLGGEEFCVISIDNTLQYANEHMNRIMSITSEKFSTTRFGEVTLSIGIVEFDKSFNTYDEILNLADKKMYEAKKSGKNTIVK
ncbi:MAG: GGDEF domain-containing protein [Aliarcobacter sp.]|nr:GGDEF domain-containing protein [Aliarcobacter sp.]